MCPVTHVYHEMYFHVNWHCHGNHGLITPGVEPLLYEAIRDYCHRYHGVSLLAVGGTQNHIHMVIQAEPAVCLSDLVGKVKGFSSHEINQKVGAKTLQWQKGYGIETFAKRNLAAMTRYVERQKEHHARGTVNETLERSGGGEESCPWN